MVTELQVSCAVAVPVTFVLVSVAGHSRTTFGGTVSAGLRVSRTVIVWAQFVLLPQASVAVQVRAITLVPAQLVVTASLYLTVTALQLSWAVAAPVLFVLVSAGHSSTTLAGQVIVGLVVSRTVIVWTQLTLLPQASVAVQVRAMTFVAPQPLVTESV